MSNWNFFFKDSLKVVILSIIYLIISINSIILIRTTNPNCGGYNIYPTDCKNYPYNVTSNVRSNVRSNVTSKIETDPTPSYNKSNTCPLDSEGMKFKLPKLPKNSLNKNLYLPYTWLKEREENENWLSYLFKYKLANIIFNQYYISRQIMTAFLNMEFLKDIPNFIYIIIPLLPIIIYFMTSLTLLVNIIIAFATYCYSWMPCENKNLFELQPLEQFLYIIIQLLSLSIMVWSGEKINNNTGLMYAIFIIITILFFVIFGMLGGFALVIGLFNSTIVFIEMLLKSYSPLVNLIPYIIDIFYSNKDIIALIITALITSVAQKNETLDVDIINTMWAVWGILILIKIIKSLII